MIWRYLIKNYLKIFFLTLLSFIALLLVIRLEEIARFAALGAEKKALFLFLSAQIPYLLPFALAISTLLASTILFHSLSRSQELTALRSSGLCLGKITYPIIFTSLLLSFLSFVLASEVATRCHLKTKEMVYAFTSKNPVILLANRKIPFLKGAWVHTTKPKKGKEIGDFIIAYLKKDHLFLFVGNDLCMQKDSLTLDHLTGLYFFDQEFIVDNQNALSTRIDLISLLFPIGYQVANDHLTFSELRLRKQEMLLAQDLDKIKWKKKIEKCNSEIVERCSLAIAPFTFTLMGIFFGIQIGRKQKNIRFVIIAILASFVLSTFFMAKSFSQLFWLAFLFYLAPHFLILILSYCSFQRIKKGIA